MTSWLSWVTVGTAALAAALLVPRPPVFPARPRVTPVLLVAVAAVVPLASARVVVLSLVMGGCLLAARSLLVRRRHRRESLEGQARVLGFCQVVAAELSAGQPAGVALERGAVEWPGLAPVVAAFELGSDVPQALREAATARGQGDLVLIAAAWQVAHHSGGGLSAAIARVARGLRAAQATRRVVSAELASARATARLMAGLPALALVMGRGIGADPVSFLVGSSAGLVCLAGGLMLGFLGLWWIEAIADGIS
ncbi:type II secretion system F family protein [Nocardioides sp.]|uniref:type II secretion system F family protein n=1 Tax=Nocardioides sp. TaxID=35761 RepID=UPI003D0FE029